MSPLVESLRSHEVLEHDYFSVDLINDSEFDIAMFDQQAKELGFDEFAGLKFIVIDNKIFIFPQHIGHLDFYQNIKTEFAGILQCAGLITIDFPQNSSPERQIYDRSLSLSKELPPEESHLYKLTEIKPKLGKFFEIS